MIGLRDSCLVAGQGQIFNDLKKLEAQWKEELTKFHLTASIDSTQYRQWGVQTTTNPRLMPQNFLEDIGILCEANVETTFKNRIHEVDQGRMKNVNCLKCALSISF